MKLLSSTPIMGPALALLLSTACTTPRLNVRPEVATVLHRRETVPEIFQLRLARDQAQALLFVITTMQNPPINQMKVLGLQRELDSYLTNTHPESRSADETNTILDGDENGPTTIRVPTTSTDSYDGFRSVTQLSRTEIIYLRQFVLAYISSNQRAFTPTTRHQMSSLEQTDCYIIPTDPQPEEQTARWERHESNCTGSDLNRPEYMHTYAQLTPAQRKGMLNLLDEFSVMLSSDTESRNQIPLHVAEAIQLVISDNQVHYTSATAQAPSTARIGQIADSILEAIRNTRVNAAIPTAISTDPQAQTTTDQAWDTSHLTLAEVSLLRTILEAYVTGENVSAITVPSYQLNIQTGERVHLPGYFHFNARHRLHILYAIAALRRIENGLISTNRS